MISNRETDIGNKRNKNGQSGENQGAPRKRELPKHIQHTRKTHATQKPKRTPEGHERQAHKDSENVATRKHKQSKPTLKQYKQNNNETATQTKGTIEPSKTQKTHKTKK